MTPDGLSFLESTKSMPLLQLPVRTTVVQLKTARVMISPGSMLTESQLRGAGEVTDIVAPSLIHTAGMARAAAAFPNARLWGVAGAAAKHPELKWHGVLGVDSWPFDAELKALPLAGMPKLNETVFVHTESRTLIVTDLVFNIEEPKGAGAWIILNIFGTWKRLAVSRLFLKYVTDDAAFRASIKALITHDFDRLAPSHGAVVERGAKDKIIAALRERKKLD